MQKICSIALFVLVACSPAGAQTSELLTVADFEKKLATTKSKQVVDVRTPAEYASGHLADAIMININQDDFKTQAAKLDKGKPVFVYCAGGVRSGKAAKVLESLGFKVYDLDGGIRAWSSAGKPVVK